MSTLDLSILIIYLVIAIGIGIYASRTANQSTSNFFLSGRGMPWWLLGMSMVATTFAADTPNLVTDIVRQNGIAGNWVWWAFCLTGMLTVFIYARLWQTSGVMTDIEFYELRYSGKKAEFLRGFRAVYLGLIFNVMVMATVTLAMIKIASILIPFDPTYIVMIGLGITLLYSLLGGLRGVLLTDFFQFLLAMTGSIGAAVYVLSLPEIGGLDALFSHPNVTSKLDLIPSIDSELFIMGFIIPLSIQWWASWYPGAEPGGGGYIVQRMLAAKSSGDAIGATLLFNIAHYALRPWPWMIVALASLIIYPTVADIQTAFPNVDVSLIGDDIAYPAMIKLLPSGLLGVVIASLVAAFMSTISTHLNWGASYLVNDVIKRFWKPTADEKTLVRWGQLSMLGLCILTIVISLYLETALKAFQFIVLMGAGTGLIFILRWFWWRINAITEIVAMGVSFIVAITLRQLDAFSPAIELVISVTITTIAWILTALNTEETDESVLQSFVEKIKPGGPGWRKFTTDSEEKWTIPQGIYAMIAGTIMVYSVIAAVGYGLMGAMTNMAIAILISAISTYIVTVNWKTLRQ